MAEADNRQVRDNTNPLDGLSAQGDSALSDHDTVARFAEDLRGLRHANSFPKLTTLQFHTGISKSTISAAFKGDRLPSEKTLRALTMFFGADVPAWLRRRNQLEQELAPEPTASQTDPAHRQFADDIGPDPIGTPPPADRSTGRDSPTGSIAAARSFEATVAPGSPRLLVLTAITVALMTAVATSLVWMAISNRHSSSQDPIIEHYVDFANGVDPMLTVCRKDATVAAAGERLEGTVYVEMIFSEHCQAAWGQVTRYDGKSADNDIGMKVYPEEDPDSPRSQEARSVSSQSVYTPLLVKRDSDPRICGIASIEQGDDETQASPPVCL